MRYERIRLRGLGPFREEVGVELDGLPGRVTAVTGENGAGKTTLLELLTGSLFRACPTRGSLRDLATERGAWVEVDVVNGQRWRVRQTVDAVSGKSEALVLNAEGAPVLDSGKVRDADAWVAAHFPAPEVVYAALFGVQGSEGFLAMKAGERKACLLRALGVERLEALAGAARERARDGKAELAALDTRIRDEQLRSGDVEDLRARLDAARDAAALATEGSAAAQSALASARDAAEVARQRRAVRGRLTAAQERAEGLRDLAARASEIRAAKAEHEAASRDAKDLMRRRDQAAEDGRRARAEVARMREEHGRWKRQAEDAAGRAARARARLERDRERVRDATERLPAARTAVTQAREGAARAQERLDELRARQVAGADERIEQLRSALRSIAKSAALDLATQRGIARDALDRDLDAERSATETPREVAAAEAERRSFLRAEGDALGPLRELEEAAALAAGLERDAETIEAAERDEQTARAEMVRLASAAREVIAVADGHEREVAALAARIEDRERDEYRLALLAQQAAEVEGVEARLAEVEAQAHGFEAELATMPPEPDSAECDVPAAQDVADRAAHDLRSRSRTVTEIEVALLRAEEGAARLAALASERARVAADLAHWNLIAAGFGRDGVQAALIDAAGPELTEIANDLLHRALGARWSIVIETTRLDSRGRREIEGLDVRVIDTERGRDGLVETYSGGERVLLGEAVSLALAVVACRHAGTERPTLIRDESGAALDPERARAWIAMVRRAAELIDAARVLVVTHSAEVAELCDSRLVVADGRVEVS